jgi:SAP domain
MTDEQDESYQANTVVELRDELSARGLPTSGNKDELVSRLEADDADDAAAEGEGAAEEEEAPAEASMALATVGATAGAEGGDVDLYKMRYSPLELPANSVAAQAFYDSNPDAVDESIELSQERQDQATAAIQTAVSQAADAGVPVQDPRIPGGTDPIPDPSLTAIYPEESVVGPPQNITLTASGANFLVSSQIGFGVFSQEEADAGLGEAGEPKWERTTFVNSSTLTTVITADLFPSPDPAIPVVVGVPGGAKTDAINFAFTEAVPPPPPEEES